MKKSILLSVAYTCCFTIILSAQNIVVDAGIKHQSINILGVNANPQSWDVNPDAVARVVDQLIDSMGCSSFRLMYDDCDWEANNDNDDPNKYNWTYYDSVYSSPRFEGIWQMIRYLNKKGITDITLSPDGATPKWMGLTDLDPGKEEEYAETIASMVIYASKRIQPAIQFNSISPINETTCEGYEGVVTTPEEFKKIYSSVAARLIESKCNNITIIGPDDCGGWAANVNAMLSDATLMSKLEYFGQHDYGNSTRKARELVNMVKHSKYPGKKTLMTEVNAVCKDCDGGTYNKDYRFDAYAGPAFQYVLQDINAGVNGVQIWEAYDSRYHHPNRTLTWSMWGIFGVNDTLKPDVYTKRTHFDVLKHLYLFVKPGDVRVNVALDSSKVADLVVSAFTGATADKLVITGINTSGKAQNLDFLIKDTKHEVSNLSVYYSNEATQFKKQKRVQTRQGRLKITIPAKTAFTLSSLAVQ
jgi:O-glycosyl hydrolase